MITIVVGIVVLIVAFAVGYVLSSKHNINYKQRWELSSRLLSGEDNPNALPQGGEWKFVTKLEKAYAVNNQTGATGAYLGMREFPYAQRIGRKGVVEERTLDTRSVQSDERKEQMREIVKRMNKGEVI